VFKDVLIVADRPHESHPFTTAVQPELLALRADPAAGGPVRDRALAKSKVGIDSDDSSLVMRVPRESD
jgi:hypothetical protein